MGQEQEVQATHLLQEGIKSGGWLLLQNCHLGLKFLPEVEDTLVKTEVLRFIFFYFNRKSL
jgi:dynein heavy chain, axonemal